MRVFGPPPRRSDRVAPLSEEAAAEVRELLNQGKRIKAIKALRGHTGLGLQEAKDVAEAMRDGRHVPIMPSMSMSLADQARELRRQDRVADAIRHVAAETGMTETESARFIDSLD